MGWSLGFLARNLFPGKAVWVERYEETTLERPMGGSGDSCVVSRLVVWCGEDKEESGHHRPKRSRLSRDDRRRAFEHSFIVKEVTGPSDRYADIDALKTEIKRVSYKIEGWFLNALSSHDFKDCAIARSIYWENIGKHRSLLIEQDLIAEGFRYHHGELDAHEAKMAVRWLAKFHFSPLPAKGTVWARGGYWSLEKRTEEYRKMRNRWLTARKEVMEEDEEGIEEFEKIDANFAKRLERSAFPLDVVLHTSAPRFPFSPQDDQAAYDTLDLEEDSNLDGDHVRRQLSNRVLEQMVVDLDKRTASSWVSTHPHHPFASDVLLHGDFKGENIFFSNENCAVCDFQWVGFGVPAMDIVSLSFASLLPDLENMEFVEQLLDEYCSAACALLKRESTLKEDRKVLQAYFEWALVDYSRYVVGSGQLYPKDGYFLAIADRILARIDHGSPLPSPKDYKRLILQDLSRHITASTLETSDK